MLVIQLPGIARARIADHLLALNAEDRRLRFGCVLSDEAIGNYVRDIDFERDALFGVYGADLKLVGACHVAQADDLAEFGVSVSSCARRQGIGTALVSRAALHARNAGIGALFMHCLSENRGIMRIARQLGMRLVTQCGEADGTLKLPSGDFTSLVDEMTQQGVALYDFSTRANVAAMRVFVPAATLVPLQTS